MLFPRFISQVEDIKVIDCLMGRMMQSAGNMWLSAVLSNFILVGGTQHSEWYLLLFCSESAWACIRIENIQIVSCSCLHASIFLLYLNRNVRVRKKFLKNRKIGQKIRFQHDATASQCKYICVSLQKNDRKYQATIKLANDNEVYDEMLNSYCSGKNRWNMLMINQNCSNTKIGKPVNFFQLQRFAIQNATLACIQNISAENFASLSSLEKENVQPTIQ